MWLKTEDKQYVNPDNGSVLFVSRYHGISNGAHGVELFRMQTESVRVGPKTLRSGYPTKEEAQAALDEFMSGQDVVEIQPPVSDEEKADSEEGK